MVSLYLNRLDLIVPPAELESVMLQHPDIADVAVIGIECKEEATELPRFVARSFPFIKHEYTYSLSWLAEPTLCTLIPLLSRATRTTSSLGGAYKNGSKLKSPDTNSFGVVSTVFFAGGT